eukprot:s113_g19.t1
MLRSENCGNLQPMFTKCQQHRHPAYLFSRPQNLLQLRWVEQPFVLLTGQAYPVSLPASVNSARWTAWTQQLESCVVVNLQRSLPKNGFKEIRRIGEGAFGQAVLVEDEQGSKLVCKMVDVREASPKEVQETRKEAQLLASFKHPFIVDYRSNFLDGGYLGIFMAYCEGGDLATQISLARDAQRRIAEPQILRWITQALLALKYIHDKHDLKSGNFFLSKAGNLKMGDFGIAKVLSSTQAIARTAIGTPYYLSPEVCQEKPYAWPADIWAMGVILYELCALKLPFDGGSNMVILEYSTFVRGLCTEMLNKVPAKRPTAGAILSRGPLQSIVQSFFEEARAKARESQEALPAVQLVKEPELQSSKVPVSAACSTQLLDQMLQEISAVSSLQSWVWTAMILMILQDLSPKLSWICFAACTLSEYTGFLVSAVDKLLQIEEMNSGHSRQRREDRTLQCGGGPAAEMAQASPSGRPCRHFAIGRSSVQTPQPWTGAGLGDSSHATCVKAWVTCSF